MKIKKLVICVAALAAALATIIPVTAEPSIQRFYPGFEGVRFVMTDEQSEVAEAVTQGPFPIEFLEEARLSSLSSWRMTDAKNTVYRLQIWEVLDSLGAYQLYTHWPEYAKSKNLERLKAPVGNWFNPEKSVFWRGNYFISVQRMDNSPLTTEEMTGLIDMFASGIELPNFLPVTVSHLPKEGMSLRSPLFYLGADTLKNNPRFPEPLLEDIGFADRIEITYAAYGPDASPLFLIGYPTHELAREYSAKIRADLDGYFSSEAVFLKRSGLLVAVFSGPEDLAVETLNQVSYSPSIQYFQKKSDEPRPSATKTFLGLITKAILGTGTFLIFIIIAGFFAGLLRYQIIQRFPKFVKRNDSIKLNLD